MMKYNTRTGANSTNTNYVTTQAINTNVQSNLKDQNTQTIQFKDKVNSNIGIGGQNTGNKGS